MGDQRNTRNLGDIHQSVCTMARTLTSVVRGRSRSLGKYLFIWSARDVADSPSQREPMIGASTQLAKSEDDKSVGKTGTGWSLSRSHCTKGRCGCSSLAASDR